MGSLGQTLPAVLRPNWGGYTSQVPNPVIFNIQTRVNPQLCTMAEAQRFLGLVLMQGDIIPTGQTATIREQAENQLYVDPAFLAAGYLPLVLEFAGPAPSPGAKDIPEPGSETVETPANPYSYEINIGMMYFSAPTIPGSQSNRGPQAFRTDFKLQVKADGSLVWVGLDQPTWQGVVVSGAPA